MACRDGHTDAVYFLLDKGANPDLTNQVRACIFVVCMHLQPYYALINYHHQQEGKTPLQVAIDAKLPLTVDAFSRKGDEVSIIIVDK